jgi:predicted sugar kinase
VPGEVTQELWRLTEEEMLPAIRRGDAAAFGEAVYHFGRLAGERFSPVQGGPFASDEIGRMVDAIRAHGVDGVGQSSWGPTVFAMTSSEIEANSLGQWLRSEMRIAESQITITHPNNCGATVT